MKRIGTVSIFIKEKDNINKVNEIITNFSELVVSRMGIPYRQEKVSVIVLIIHATTDELGAMSGKLGNLNGVSVKAIFEKK